MEGTFERSTTSFFGLSLIIDRSSAAIRGELCESISPSSGRILGCFVLAVWALDRERGDGAALRARFVRLKLPGRPG